MDEHSLFNFKPCIRYQVKSGQNAQVPFNSNFIGDVSRGFLKHAQNVQSGPSFSLYFFFQSLEITLLSDIVFILLCLLDTSLLSSTDLTSRKLVYKK